MKIAYVCADPGIPLLGAKGASVHVREITSALARRGHTLHILCVCVFGEGNPEPPVTSIQHCDTPERLDEGVPPDLARASGLDVVLERYSLESGTARRTSRDAAVPLVLEANAPIVLEAARWRGLRDPEGHLVAERETLRTADGDHRLERACRVCIADSARRCRATHSEMPTSCRSRRRCRTADDRRTRPRHRICGEHEAVAWRRRTDRRLRPAARTDMLVRLVLVGDGPNQRELRECVADHAELAAVVDFVGPVPHQEMPHVLATFDIGTAPYLDSEQFYFSPLKIVEYLASGLPVVYPKIGDLPTLVADGGLAYHPADADALLARSILPAVCDRALRERCVAAAARAMFWHATAKNVEALLASVLRPEGMAR